MTVVAYRDGVMAADTMGVLDDDDINTSVKFLNERKVQKSFINKQPYLWAVAGTVCPSDIDVRKWIHEHVRASAWTRWKRMKGVDFELLLVTPSRRILDIDHKGFVQHITWPFYAVGSGQEYALGALAAGKSAREAVAIAIKYCPTCSGRVRYKHL